MSACDIDAGDYDSNCVVESTRTESLGNTTCCECKKPILEGDEYILNVCKTFNEYEDREAYENGEDIRPDDLDIYPTCMGCEDIKKTFFTNGYVFTNVWADMFYGCIDALIGDFPESKVNSMSDEGKAKFFEIWEFYRGDE